MMKFYVWLYRDWNFFSDSNFYGQTISCIKVDYLQIEDKRKTHFFNLACIVTLSVYTKMRSNSLKVRFKIALRFYDEFFSHPVIYTKLKRCKNIIQTLEVKNFIFRPDIYVFIIFNFQKKKFETIIHVKKDWKERKVLHFY